MEIILSILYLLLFYCFYLLHRNDNVCDFRNKVLKSIPHDDKFNYHLDVITSVSYSKMLFSFRPLKVSVWYPELRNEDFVKNIKLYGKRIY